MNSNTVQASNVRDVNREIRETYRRIDLRNAWLAICFPLVLAFMTVTAVMNAYHYWDVGYGLALGTPLFFAYCGLMMLSAWLASFLPRIQGRERKRVPAGFPRFSDDALDERERQRLLLKYRFPSWRVTRH